MVFDIFSCAFSVWALLSTSSSSYVSSSSWVAVIALHHHYSEATQTLTLEGRNRWTVAASRVTAPSACWRRWELTQRWRWREQTTPATRTEGTPRSSPNGCHPPTGKTSSTGKWSLFSECVGENDHYLVSVWEKMVTIQWVCGRKWSVSSVWEKMITNQ